LFTVHPQNAAIWKTLIRLPSTLITANTTTSIHRYTPSTTRSHNRSLTPAKVDLHRLRRTYQFHPLPAIGRSDIQPPPPLRATRSPQSHTDLLSPQSCSAATAGLSSATQNSVTNHLQRRLHRTTADLRLQQPNQNHKPPDAATHNTHHSQHQFGFTAAKAAPQPVSSSSAPATVHSTIVGPPHH